MATKDINDAAKPIQDAWDLIKNDYFQINPGHYLAITTVYRSPAEQLELFKQGRTLSETGEWVVEDKDKIVTNVDGIKILGAHNYHPSRAIDVAVVDNQSGKTLWDEKYYHCLLEIASRVGLESGGAWHSIKDWPHLQLKDYKNYKGA